VRVTSQYLRNWGVIEMPVCEYAGRHSHSRQDEDNPHTVQDIEQISSLTTANAAYFGSALEGDSMIRSAGRAYVRVNV
jgi:hypothetical protein